MHILGDIGNTDTKLTGHWMPRRKGKRNAPLISTIRGMWRRLQRRRPGEATLRHVRSHIKVPGNELADWLAERGKLTQRADMLQPAIEHMRAWLREHRDTTHEDAGNSAPAGGRGPWRDRGGGSPSREVCGAGAGLTVLSNPSPRPAHALPTPSHLTLPVWHGGHPAAPCSCIRG